LKFNSSNMFYPFRAFVLSCFRDNSFLFRMLHNLTCNRTGGKISALMTEDYLSQRARRADRNQFKKILDKVPARKPLPDDEL
ncbi:MAG: hypothetical protein U9Q89_09415, partial [Thermodesulfobacteriota bacterium]|nr:hypothetical protein [Thermodesulfobacteriota bacterium]